MEKIQHNMSLLKELFVLRESMDMALIGKTPNIKVVDICYDDLVKAITEYELMLKQIEEFNKTYQNNTEDIDNNIITTQDIYNVVAKQFGENYNKLLLEIDRLNEEYKTGYQVYITNNPEDKTKYILKIWDENTGILKRMYEDKEDLDLNLELDLQSQFNNKKININTTNKLSTDPFDNLKSEGFTVKNKDKKNDKEN